MKLSEITPENVGAVCRLFRQNVLKISQMDFALNHHISNAAISYFERGLSVSLVSFLAYVNDGLENYLFDISLDAVNSIVGYNRIYQKEFAGMSLRDIGKLK